MRAETDQLGEDLQWYRAYLMKMQVDRCGVTAGAQGELASNLMSGSRVYDKDYATIMVDERIKSANPIVTADLLATVSRIQEALNSSGPYTPVRIDNLLLSDEEAKATNRLRKKKNERLKFVLEKAVFQHDEQLYRYDIGQHFVINPPIEKSNH